MRGVDEVEDVFGFGAAVEGGGECGCVRWWFLLLVVDIRQSWWWWGCWW